MGRGRGTGRTVIKFPPGSELAKVCVWWAANKMGTSMKMLESGEINNHLAPILRLEPGHPPTPARPRALYIIVIVHITSATPSGMTGGGARLNDYLLTGGHFPVCSGSRMEGRGNERRWLTWEGPLRLIQLCEYFSVIESPTGQIDIGIHRTRGATRGLK